MFGNDKLSPDLFLGLGGGLLSGQTGAQQIGNAAIGASGVLAAQKEKAKAEEQKNLTYSILQKLNPEQAELYKAGAIDGKQAVDFAMQARKDAAAAAKPEYMTVDGRIVKLDKAAGKAEEIANFKDPNADAPPTVQEFLWAQKNQGFTGSLEDYQKNKISLKNQKGTEGNLKGDLETMKAYRGDDSIKAYQVVHSAYQKARSAAQLGTSAGDMSLIYAFMKMNDPTSVVREGEFATAANTGGLDDKIINIYNRTVDGQMLTPDQRAQFMQAADAQYSDVAKNVEDVNSRYTPFASDYNVNTDRFMIQPEKFEPLKVGSPAVSITSPDGNVLGTIRKTK